MNADRSTATADRRQVVMETAYLRAFGSCVPLMSASKPVSLLPSRADFLRGK